MSDVRALHSRAHALAALAGLALIVLSALIPAAPVRAANYTVDNTNFAFVPGELTIVVGDTVAWTNSDPVPHTATAGNGTFDSGALDQGDTYSFTFQSVGAFPYLCDYHSQMAGTITVQAAAATSAGQGTTPNTAMSELANGAASIAGLIGLGILLVSLAALAGREWRRRQPNER